MLVFLPLTFVTNSISLGNLLISRLMTSSCSMCIRIESLASPSFKNVSY